MTAAVPHVQSPVIQRREELKDDFADYDCDYNSTDQQCGAEPVFGHLFFPGSVQAD